MKQLPVGRNAVLSYFGQRFDEAANRYLQYRVDKVKGDVFSANQYNGTICNNIAKTYCLQFISSQQCSAVSDIRLMLMAIYFAYAVENSISAYMKHVQTTYQLIHVPFIYQSIHVPTIN